MLMNPRRRRRTRRNALALANPRRRRRYVKVWHVATNPRGRRRGGRRSRSGGGGIVVTSPAGFISARFLTQAGMAAVGAVTPSLLTDRVLPAIGFTTSGWTRRLIQLAVPTVVVMIGGRKLLGAGTNAFAFGAYGVTLLNIFTDVAGGAPLMGRYALPAPGVGRYNRTPPVLVGAR